MKNDLSKNLSLIPYLLIGFAVIITMNLLLIRYPGDLILPLIKASILSAGVIVYGFGFNFLFGRYEVELPEALASGLIFTTFYFFLISSLGLLNPASILLFYLIPALLMIFFMIKKRSILSRSLSGFFKRPFPEYAIFIFPLIYASLPSSFYDTMVYHLGIPNLFIQHNGFIQTSQMIYANTSIYYEISLIPAVFAGPLVPRLFHFFIGMIFCLTLADTAVRFFNVKKKLLLLVMLVSIPVTFFLLTTVKNDLIGAFFILIGIRYFLKENYKLSAVFWGFSIGVKYFNALPLAIFLILFLLRDKFRDLKGDLKVVSLYGIVTFILLLPLFIKNYIYMNNPFFPFLTNIFDSGIFDHSRYEFMKSDVGVLIHSIKDLYSLPFTLSFREVGSGGLTGIQFLVFLPFVMLIKKIKRVMFLYFSLILLIAGAFFTSSVRFGYIAVALLSIYVILVYENLDSIRAGIIKILIFVLIALNIVTAFGYHERIYKAADLYSGKLDMEEYKIEMLPSYSAISYINHNTPGNARILIVGDTRNFYLLRKYNVSSAIDYSILKGYLSGASDIVDFIRVLREDGIDYILYNMSEFQRLNKKYKRLDKEESEKFFGFVKYLTPVFEKGYSCVYKIPDRI